MIKKTGTCIDDMIPGPLLDAFNQLGISREPDPIKLHASVLTTPTLEFGSGLETPEEGSWKIHPGIKFLHSAQVGPFAVLDLTAGRKNDQHLKQIFERVNELGISSNVPMHRHLPHVTVRAQNYSTNPHAVRWKRVSALDP
jgi:hypothetical protein